MIVSVISGRKSSYLTNLLVEIRQTLEAKKYHIDAMAERGAPGSNEGGHARLAATCHKDSERKRLLFCLHVKRLNEAGHRPYIDDRENIFEDPFVIYCPNSSTDRAPDF